MTVIKHRDVLQYILLSLISSLVVSPLNPFLFQTAEETFCNSIIKTIPSSVHAVVKPIAHAHEPKVSYRYIELLMHQIYFWKMKHCLILLQGYEAIAHARFDGLGCQQA